MNRGDIHDNRSPSKYFGSVNSHDEEGFYGDASGEDG